ncbi:MAG TPA: hypothetical protein PK880_05680 [Candidatus Competibacter sp.]|nr:hypothetical protein [Candidatus Competibacter sp.]
MPRHANRLRSNPAARLLRLRQGSGWALWVLLWIAALPVQAQVSEAKVAALVEALRLSAPEAEPDSGLYGDWRVKPENIKRWSKVCLNREVTPEQFAADQALARQVLVCVMDGVLRDQLAASDENEIVAVQRAAAWWLTGEPERYRSAGADAYTLKVLEAYLRFL